MIIDTKKLVEQAVNKKAAQEITAGVDDAVMEIIYEEIGKLNSSKEVSFSAGDIY